MGETAAPLAGNAEGAKLPCREVVRKDQPGSLGTEEKASVLSGYWPPHAYTFERYESVIAQGKREVLQGGRTSITCEVGGKFRYPIKIIGVQEGESLLVVTAYPLKKGKE